MQHRTSRRATECMDCSVSLQRLSHNCCRQPACMPSPPPALLLPGLPAACADRCLAKTASCACTSSPAFGAQVIAVRCSTSVCLAARAAVKGPRLRVGIDARQPSGAAVLTTLGQSRWDASIIIMNEPTRAAENRPAWQRRRLGTV